MITVSVTNSHIKRAKLSHSKLKYLSKYAETCPIALALKDKLKKTVFVCPIFILIDKKDYYPASSSDKRKIQHFISRFDRNYSVRPITIHLQRLHD